MNALSLLFLALFGLNHSTSEASISGPTKAKICQTQIELGHKYEKFAANNDKELQILIRKKAFNLALSSLYQANQNLSLAQAAYQGLITLSTGKNCKEHGINIKRVLKRIALRKKKIRCHELVTHANISFLRFRGEKTLPNKVAYVEDLKAISSSRSCGQSIRASAQINIKNHTDV